MSVRNVFLSYHRAACGFKPGLGLGIDESYVNRIGAH